MKIITEAVVRHDYWELQDNCAHTYVDAELNDYYFPMDEEEFMTYNLVIDLETGRWHVSIWHMPDYFVLCDETLISACEAYIRQNCMDDIRLGYEIASDWAREDGLEPAPLQAQQTSA